MVHVTLDGENNEWYDNIRRIMAFVGGGRSFLDNPMGVFYLFCVWKIRKKETCDPCAIASRDRLVTDAAEPWCEANKKGEC